VKPGTFGSAVDFDSYWHPEAMKRMDKSAPTIHAHSSTTGAPEYFQETPQPYADLGELVIGSETRQRAGR